MTGCFLVRPIDQKLIDMQAAIDYFLPLFKMGELAPVVDEREFSLNQIVEAFRHLESNDQFGKVVVEI